MLMPRYVLLIYDDEQAWAAMTQERSAELTGAYQGYTDDLRRTGAFVAGDALLPTATATTVAVVDGETLTTDGPYAETKEQLGGFYLIEAADLDEAIDLAARVPSTKMGGRIEVRPVMELPDRAAE
jgi:hypothetical protein